MELLKHHLILLRISFTMCPSNYYYVLERLVKSTEISLLRSYLVVLVLAMEASASEKGHSILPTLVPCQYRQKRRCIFYDAQSSNLREQLEFQLH